MKILSSVIVIIALGLQVQGTKLGRQLKESVCADKDGVLVAMPGSCSGFFFCIEGNAIASSCGNFYHFNERLSICDHPKNALCQKPVIKTKVLAVESDQEAEDICGRSNNKHYIFGKSMSCNQFYVCLNGKALRRVCPPQKHYNQKLKICQDIELAQCAYAKPMPLTQPLELSTKDQELTTMPIPPTKHSLKKRQVPDYICSRAKQTAMIPHPWDCGLYVYCVHGKPNVMNCPKGLHFSIQRQRCEWPAIAKCMIE